MARGPRNLHVSVDGLGLTQFGGVTLIEQFFQRIGLQGSFSQRIRFPQRNTRYSISESLEALLYPLILGLGRIETTEPLRYNGVFHYLAGLPGYPMPRLCDASSIGSLAEDETPSSSCTMPGAQRCWANPRKRSSIWTARS